MKGGIYTKEKCPVCKKNYQTVAHVLICPDHFTRPKRVFIQVYSKKLRKVVNILTNQDNQPFRSYEEAERILEVIRAEVDRRKGGDFDPSRYVSTHLKPYRFTTFVDSWIEKKSIEAQKGRRAPAYIKALRVYASKWKAFFDLKDIREITSSDVHDFYLSLDGAPKYVKNVLDALKKLFSDALEWGKIQEIPRFPKIETPEIEIRTIDLDQQDMVVNAITDSMTRAFVLLTARQMIRPSETRGLQWEDLDLKHDRITIRRHFSLNQVRPATKARQIKVLPLDGEVKQTLLALPRHISSPFVFWRGKQGKPFSESWARRVWRETSRKLGIKISLYQGTRHSSATEAVNRVGVDATQEFLHHTSRQMTKRYAKVNPEGLKKVLRDGR